MGIDARCYIALACDLWQMMRDAFGYTVDSYDE